MFSKVPAAINKRPLLWHATEHTPLFRLEWWFIEVKRKASKVVFYEVRGLSCWVVRLTSVLHFIDLQRGPSALTMDERFMTNNVRGPCKASFVC